MEIGMKLLILFAIFVFSNSIYATTRVENSKESSPSGAEVEQTEVIVSAGEEEVLATLFKDSHESSIRILIKEQETARRLFEKSTKPNGASCTEGDELKTGDLYKSVFLDEKVLVGLCFKVCESEYYVCSINFNYY